MIIGLALSPSNHVAGRGEEYVLRIAATLGRVSGAQTVDGGDGTNTQAISRTVHRTGRNQVRGLRVVAGHFKLIGVSPFGEAGFGNSATYRTALEVGGVNVPVTWGGASSKVVSDLSTAVSDPIADIVSGQTFYVRHLISVATTANKWGRAQTVTQGDQRALKATDASSYLSGTGSLIGGSTDAPHPPLALIGLVPRSTVSVVYTGDSIADNTGDLTTIDADGTVGFVGRGLVGVNGYNIPHVKMSRSGETQSGLVSAGALRFSIMAYATHFIDEGGSNDITAGRSLAQIQADCLTIWAAARAAGIQKIYRTTILPRTTSTDSWATTTNQTPVANFAVGGIRDQLNAWFPTKVADGTIDGVIDVNADCAHATATDRWRVDLGAGNNTADGTHPASPLHTIMAARVNAAAATWTAR